MCEWLFSRPNCCYWRRRKGDLKKLKEQEWNSKKSKWGWDSQIAYLNLPSRLWATQQPFEDSCITFADKVMFRCQCWFCIKSNTSPHFLTVVKGLNKAWWVQVKKSKVYCTDIYNNVTRNEHLSKFAMPVYPSSPPGAWILQPFRDTYMTLRKIWHDLILHREIHS